MDKRFWAIIGVIIVVFAGILMVNNNSKDKDASSGSNAKATEHIRGKADSKVKLVEYGDFQCPYCGQYYPIVEQVVAKYEDKIAYQFRNLPLNQIHQNAFAASRAAEAADEQGKFWDMYHLLYQNQKSWSDSTSVNSIFNGYAEQLKLNLTQFKKDFASSKVNARINADKEAFNKTKEAVSTPTFFLNGKKIEATSADEFGKLIDAELKKNGQ
ncbi:MAG TPA: thioredoxin domain-containing protein [Candidatus Saccharimonadales bacterium]|nr:thioredoxin domain-containing protein [Candidatus Saccharimonadales bacterium]